MNLKTSLQAVLFCCFAQITYATHIWGGELTYKRVSASSLTYEFTLTGYTDTGSPVRFADGIINFGDGREAQIDLEADSFEDGKFFGQNMERELYVIKITHTYNSPGTYFITYQEPNRNDEVVNINLGQSTQIPFLIKSMVVIDPEIGLNSSPEFNTVPIDFGFVGKTFTHNTWAQDPDGDSLAYRLITPKMDRDQPVTNYLTPNNREFYRPPFEWSTGSENGDSPAIYEINPFTGDLIWDAPGNFLKNSQGDFSEYNIALLVEEWRQINDTWRIIGYVTRDFLVMVTPEDIGRPDFELPEDQILTVSETINEQIAFNDPDGDPIKVEFFGEIFNLANNPMKVTPTPGEFANGPLSFELEWTSLPEHARQRPYYVHMKITDNPANPGTNPAVTYKTWILSFDALPDVITGLSDEPRDTELALFPNPASDILRWQTPPAMEPKFITIFNSLGQRTISMNLTSYGVKEIDVGGLVTGVYLVRLATGKRTYQARFVKR